MRDIEDGEDVRIVTASDLPRDAWFTTLCIIIGFAWVLGVLMGAIGMGWFLAMR